MREIKFRAQHIETGEWKYGSIIKFGISGWAIREFEYAEAVGYKTWEIDPKTVGQYTGLKDKNGKEIYDGDVVRGEKMLCVGFDEQGGDLCEDVTQPITFSEGCFWLGDESYDFSMPLHYAIQEQNGLEIIGNIYENPELLKQ